MRTLVLREILLEQQRLEPDPGRQAAREAQARLVLPAVVRGLFVLHRARETLIVIEFQCAAVQHHGGGKVRPAAQQRRRKGAGRGQPGPLRIRVHLGVDEPDAADTVADTDPVAVFVVREVAGADLMAEFQRASSRQRPLLLKADTRQETAIVDRVEIGLDNAVEAGLLAAHDIGHHRAAFHVHTLGAAADHFNARYRRRRNPLQPPGTGDIQLTLAQRVPVTGAVIVTTPQDIALLDARKGLKMFEKVNVPILGIVENMSTHICSKCGHEEHIFGTGGGERMAKDYGVDMLGSLPLTLQIREETDSGTPTVVADPDGQVAKIYKQIARRVAVKVGELQKDMTSKFPNIVIQNT